MKVLPQKEAARFLNAEIIGQERYKLFAAEKSDGDGSVYETLKKEKLPTFINSNKTVKVKIDNKEV